MTNKNNFFIFIQDLVFLVSTLHLFLEYLSELTSKFSSNFFRFRCLNYEKLEMHIHYRKF